MSLISPCNCYLLLFFIIFITLLCMCFDYTQISMSRPEYNIFFLIMYTYFKKFRIIGVQKILLNFYFIMKAKNMIDGKL